MNSWQVMPTGNSLMLTMARLSSLTWYLDMVGEPRLSSMTRRALTTLRTVAMVGDLLRPPS